MSLDLAYLVLERCPLRGQVFRALLILALDADEHDEAFVSTSKLARWGRFTRARAQEMLEFLHEQKWILKGNQSTRHIMRRRLMALPPIDGATPRKLAGEFTTSLELKARLRASQVAADLHELHFSAK